MVTTFYLSIRAASIYGFVAVAGSEHDGLLNERMDDRDEYR